MKAVQSHSENPEKKAWVNVYEGSGVIPVASFSYASRKKALAHRDQHAREFSHINPTVLVEFLSAGEKLENG